MRDEVRAFVIASLQAMNYGVDGIDDGTMLGPAGLDLESLALADLLMRLEDRYHIEFAPEECKDLALLSVGDFTTAVLDRVSQTAGSKRS